MTFNSIRPSAIAANPKTDVEKDAKPGLQAVKETRQNAFKGKEPLAEQLSIKDIQRALHDDYDLISMPLSYLERGQPLILCDCDFRL